MSKKNINFCFFNLFKFVGALVIALILHPHEHFYNWLGIQGPYSENSVWEFYSTYGYVFVEMFFLISGILFYTAYKNRILQGESFDEFIVKRIFRVSPIALISIVFLYFMQALLWKNNGILFDNTGSIDPVDLAVNLVFLGQLFFTRAYKLNGPIWYIGALIACYCLAYILVKLHEKLSSYAVYALPIFVGFVLWYLPQESVVFNHDVARALINFFLGIYIALFLKLYDFLKPIYKMIIGVGCVSALILLALMIQYVTNMSLAFTCFVFPELIVLFYSFKHLNRLFSMPLFSFLGKISFGIYVWNFPILCFYYFLTINGKIVVPDSSSTFWGGLLLTHILVAIFSYYCLERPLGKWLKKCERVLIQRMCKKKI